jgi:hypothetical protein
MGAAVRRPRILVLVGGLVGAGVVVLVLALVGGGAGSAGVALGRFAGYEWDGNERSVAASWSVPRIVSGPSPSWATAWLGAQGPGSGVKYPFIQVGTNEQRYTVDPTIGQRTVYTAFWTDTTHHFLARELFGVAAGDRMSARLSLARGRWTVSVTDHTSRQHAQLTTTDEGHARLTMAEWYAEHVISSTGQKPIAYPMTTTLRFTGLLVNGHQPVARRLLSHWMTLPGHDLAPSAADADAFAVAAATLSGPAKRYLGLVDPLNEANRVFTAAITRWNTTTAATEITRATTTDIQAFQAADRGLADEPWPADAAGPVHALKAANQALIAEARRADRLRPNDRAAWAAAWIQQDDHTTSIGQQIRRALHAPDLNPPP